MKNIFIIGAVLIILAISGFYFFTGTPRQEMPSENPETETAAGTPIFTWSYQTSEDTDIPHTAIELTATYENGTSETKIIDNIEGSCDTYENADEDVYERSTMIICYYAGLGHYFKVVADSNGYSVKRNVFEEASPEYDPPHQPYETVAIF